MPIDKNNPIFTLTSPPPLTNFECKNDKTAVAQSPLLKFAQFEPEIELNLYDKKEDILNSLQTKVTENYDVQKNLFKGTAEDLNKCLKGTPIEGLGQAFIDAQNKYGVNALFLMSIVKVESKFGKYPAKEGTTVHQYNIMGLKTSSGKYRDNKSYAECVDSGASSLQRLYFNNKSTALVTVQQIQNKYCPGNKKWTQKICDEMNNLSSTILEQYK